MFNLKSLLIAVALLYIGGWQPLWSVAPKDVLQLAAQGNVINGGSIAAEDLSALGLFSQTDAGAEALIGNYFVSSGGFAVVVNDHYFGAEITNRFFNSIALSWIMMILALSAIGFRFFFFI